MSPTPESQRQFLPLARLARETLDASLTGQEIAKGEIALLKRLAARKRRRKTIVTLLAVAAMVAIGLTGWKASRPPSNLTYQLANAGSGEEGYVRAALGHGSAQVDFSDGSQFVFEEGSTGRVEAVRPTGARMAIEYGGVHVHVIHQDRSLWELKAGPFDVAVTGTEFDASWSPERETFQVALRRGVVTIHGPLASDGITLHAGQTFSADLRAGSARVDDGRAHADILPKEHGRSSVTEDLPDVSAVGSSVPPKMKAVASWSKMIAAGDFAAVLEQADAKGLDVCLSSCSLPDLASLADAARYGQRAGLARRAYLATRTRFPHSPEAHQAAFLIGRLADTDEGPDAAIRWYDTYLAENPGGSFAEEALGRKMVATNRSSSPAGAKPLADQYLKLYPTGAFAEAARSLRSNP